MVVEIVRERVEANERFVVQLERDGHTAVLRTFDDLPSGERLAKGCALRVATSLRCPVRGVA